jgi:alkylation response protein AidB-like acyl-CoA dehydrogenase
MDFSLTQDQQLLRDSAARLLQQECPPALVRAHLRDPAVAGELWQHLAGWAGVAGGSAIDLCLFLEETGAVAAPGPFFATTALFAPVLQALDHDLLPAVLEGSATGTVAVAGAAATWEVNRDPIKTFVSEAGRVDWIAVLHEGPSGPEVVIGRRPEDGVTITPTVDGSRQFATVEAAAVSGERLPIAPEAVEAVIQRATVGLAAEMLGTVRWLFETTLAYAKVREQFDRPIGSFQALQHKLANMALAKERAWSSVYYAAMTLDASDDVAANERRRAVHVAKAAAGSAARLNLKDGIQIHGGIGYTWEHDLHLFMRRALVSEQLLGTAGWHHDRLGELLVAGGPVA